MNSIINPTNTPGREISLTAMQFLQALVNQYPGLTREMANGITITVSNETKTLFSITGDSRKERGLIL